MRTTLSVFLGLLITGCGGEELEAYYTGNGGPEIQAVSVVGADGATSAEGTFGPNGDAIGEDGNLGGNTVVIQGSGFGDDAGAIVVVFGDENAEILSVTDGAIEAVVPVGPVNGGAVDIGVATSDGYTFAEEAYTYDVGDITADQSGYVMLQNYSDTVWGVYIGYNGIQGDGEFLNFAYPRVHTPGIGFWGNSDVAPEGEWSVQRPAATNYVSGISELRERIGDFTFVSQDEDQDGWYQCVDAESLSPGLETQNPDNCDDDQLVYKLNELDFCEVPGQSDRDQGVYRADWPADSSFFYSSAEDETVTVSTDITDLGIEGLDLLLPPQLSVDGVEGFNGTQGEWTYGSGGIGKFDSCFDDDNDSDADTTLADNALTFEWTPIASEIDLSGGSSQHVKAVETHVRISITILTISWIGGENYTIRASTVVPDDYNYDEATGLSSIDMPVEVFYQFPTADVNIGGSGIGGQPIYSDPMSSDFGYMLVEADRVTEYQVESDLGGDLIVAYATGEFGLFDYTHPLDKDGDCEDCIDADGDGWVDEQDPDCDDDNREDGTDETEDNNTFGMYTCNDGIDNDGDGDIDADDADCSSGDEMESNCDNGIDDDGDGWVDGDDGECGEGASGIELGIDPWDCSDGVDTDGDGWDDFSDPDCTWGGDDELGYGDTACNDGIDNDGNNDVDADDVYCANEGATADTEAPEMDMNCVDDEDNTTDQDGYTDHRDPDCEVSTYKYELDTHWEEGDQPVIPTCYDGIDNDEDGCPDALDPDCHESNGTPNGFFAEAGNVMPTVSCTE